jgi:hypothetical protein
MEIRLLERRTRLKIEILTSEAKPMSDEVLTGAFYDMDKGMTFYLSCDQLVERFPEFDKSLYLRFSLSVGYENYSFLGKLNSVNDIYGERLIHVSIVSPLEKSSLRQTARIEITLPVQLYRAAPNSPDQAGELLCKGVTQDICSNGVCVLSDFTIAKEDYDRIVVELDFSNGEKYFLRVNLLKSGNSPQSGIYKYDYVFLFDKSESLEKKSDLFKELFDEKRRYAT